MKTLIVYYSHSSNNAFLARALQARLGCDMLRIEEKNHRSRFTIVLDRIFGRTPSIREHSLHLNEFSHFIFVAPIWTSGIATPLKAFLIRERHYINHYSFISLCGGRPGQAELIARELAAYVQQDPETVDELWISDLVPPEKREDPRFVMDYKVTQEDLEYFSLKIDHFLDAVLPAVTHE